MKNKSGMMGSFLGVIILSFFLSSCGMRSIPMSYNEVEASWAEVQNQYKRRADLIPNLVEVVKGYAKHEQETLTGVIEARSKATQVHLSVDELDENNLKKFQSAQQGLSMALGKLMALSERYPDLKANQNFRELQVQLEGTENRITVSRNRYIQSIQKFNDLVSVPPTSWYNSLFLKYEKRAQFQVENLQQVSEPPKIKF